MRKMGKKFQYIMLIIGVSTWTSCIRAGTDRVWPDDLVRERDRMFSMLTKVRRDSDQKGLIDQSIDAFTQFLKVLKVRLEYLQNEVESQKERADMLREQQNQLKKKLLLQHERMRQQKDHLDTTTAALQEVRTENKCLHNKCNQQENILQYQQHLQQYERELALYKKRTEDAEQQLVRLQESLKGVTTTVAGVYKEHKELFQHETSIPSLASPDKLNV